MNRMEFVALNQAYNASQGRAGITGDVELNRIVKNSQVFKCLQEKGYLDGNGCMVDKGLAALKSYKVDNAVILAAGSASRFIPLSLEQPKGLYEVKGEPLIERQIQQLFDAGIRDITIVVGYKKEMFAYLQNKYSAKLIFNPLYNVKNNIESLYVARHLLKNTYICVCDSYFTENPFNAYEYESFYAGYKSQSSEEEMYAVCDDDNRILEMKKGLSCGDVLLGHSFWTKDFSKAFVQLMEEDRFVGKYNQSFWEWLVKDHLNQLPPYYFKEYDRNMIHEFDYFDQLRAFDNRYVEHSHSEIIRNIKLIFRCDEEDIVDFRPVTEGMTNTSFIFRIHGVDYIYRYPGEGTEKIINRQNEKHTLILAKKFDIDPTYIYMDVDEGWKVSRYVHHFREPDYGSVEDSKRVLSVLRKLHHIPVKVDYGMRPWEDALQMESMLRDKDDSCFKPFENLKDKVFRLYEKTKQDDVNPCFCHGDTYKHNWMIREDGSVILIDWEYAGYSDPGIDVGYYIVDAMYDFKDANRFILEYLGETATPEGIFHFMAYIAIIAYYWFVWAMYRKSCGADVGDSMKAWHLMAMKYADHLCGND